MVHQVPIIGTWVYSNDPTEKILEKKWLIWALVTEFVVGPHFHSKITKDGRNNFIFVAFQKC
jgi:hypothetical protein